MDLVFQAFELLRVTEYQLRQLHQLLHKHSTQHQLHKDKSGEEIRVVFETSTPFDIPREMEELVHWVGKALNEASMHPLLIAADNNDLYYKALHRIQKTLKDENPDWES